MCGLSVSCRNRASDSIVPQKVSSSQGFPAPHKVGSGSLIPTVGWNRYKGFCNIRTAGVINASHNIHKIGIVSTLAAGPLVIGYY